MTTSVYYAKREVLEARRKLAEAEGKLKAARVDQQLSSGNGKFMAAVAVMVVSIVALTFVGEILNQYND